LLADRVAAQACAAKSAPLTEKPLEADMNPLTPSDLIWETIMPLLGALDPMHSFVDWSSAYVPECAAIGVGTALLMLTGAVLYNRSSSEPSAHEVMTTPQVPSMG
jgi:hypothetical protein